jgi:hypothetical protein
MWRVVYELTPKGGHFNGPGPWHRSEEEAENWLDYLRPYYPTAHLQSWQEAYPKATLMKA